MIASPRRRGQEQDNLGFSGGIPGDGESFWSSFSVVESLFSDEQGSLPSSKGGEQSNGSRLPFMRQLKSQEAFPPLPPSSSPYEESANSHHGSPHRSRHNGQQRRNGGGSGEWITPHVNAAPGHQLFSPPPPVGNSGQNYYNAFNGYNQHFIGMPNVVNDVYGDSIPNGNSNSNGFHNGFSVFSDYRPRHQQHNGGAGLGQNAFTAVPDIGVTVERHHHSPRSGADSPSMYSSPILTRKNSPSVVPREPKIITAPTITTSNKICCDEKTLLEEELQAKGAPFSLLLALPNEHLLRIMGYLAGRDLVNLQQVGKKRLAVLSTDNGLWKELYLKRWKLEIPSETAAPVTTTTRNHGKSNGNRRNNNNNNDNDDKGGDESDEWAWIHSLLQQNERWKDIYQSRHSAERWRIGTLKMFNGCWGFISQHAPDNSAVPLANGETLDIFFHRKDIAPEGDWYEDWWLKDTPGVSRSQKCGYWDTFLCGRVVRYKQRAAYAQGRRPQACNISFVGEERRTSALQHGPGGAIIIPEGMVLPPTMRFPISNGTNGN